jgi:hypothetical protein
MGWEAKYLRLFLPFLFVIPEGNLFFADSPPTERAPSKRRLCFCRLGGIPRTHHRLVILKRSEGSAVVPALVLPAPGTIRGCPRSPAVGDLGYHEPVSACFSERSAAERRVRGCLPNFRIDGECPGAKRLAIGLAGSCKIPSRLPDAPDGNRNLAPSQGCRSPLEHLGKVRADCHQRLPRYSRKHHLERNPPNRELQVDICTCRIIQRSSGTASFLDCDSAQC